MFFHFLSFSIIFSYVLSFSFIFSYVLSFFIVFHFLSFSLPLLGAQNLIFLGLNFVTISLDNSYVKKKNGASPDCIVVVEWLYYSKRIIVVRWADLSEFFFVDFRR